MERKKSSVRRARERERERASLFHFFFLFPHSFSSFLQPRSQPKLLSNEPRGPGPLRGPSRRAQGPRRARPGPGVGPVPPGAQDGGQGRFFQRRAKNWRRKTQQLLCASPSLLASPSSSCSFASYADSRLSQARQRSRTRHQRPFTWPIRVSKRRKKAHQRNHHDEKKKSPTINFVNNRRRTASPWPPSSSPRTRPRPTCLLPSGRIR